VADETTTARTAGAGLRAVRLDSRPLPAVVDDQPFRIELERAVDVEIDRKGNLVNGPSEIEVELSSTTGDSTTVRLVWDGAPTGPARYRSEEMTTEWGGGSRLTILGFEFNVGGGVDTAENGEPVGLVAETGETGSLRVYDAATQLAAGEAAIALDDGHAYFTNLVLNFEGALKVLGSNPDADPGGTLRRRADAALADARLRLAIIDRARVLVADTEHLTLPERAAVGYEALRLLSLPPGQADLDRTRVARRLEEARKRGEQHLRDLFDRGIADAGIGLYQVVTDVTYAGAGYTVLTGENVKGEEASAAERWMAVLTLVLAAADVHGIVSLATWEGALLTGPVRDVSAGGGVLTAEANALKASVGTNLAPSDLGMLAAAGRDAARVARRYDVVILVRPTNDWAQYWRLQRALPKGTDLKAKTITPLDQLLGADPDLPPGRVGFFEPKLPDDAVMARLDDATKANLLARYDQRLEEWTGPTGDKIRALIDKGTYRVERGAIHTADGRPVAGDHDLWEILDANGTPVSGGLYDAVVTDLMNAPGFAARHGAHMRWLIRRADYATDEAFATDVGIFEKIVRGHGPGEEVLIAFDGRSAPFAIYSDTPGLPLRVGPAAIDEGVEAALRNSHLHPGMGAMRIAVPAADAPEPAATERAERAEPAAESGRSRLALWALAGGTAIVLAAAIAVLASRAGDGDGDTTAVGAGPGSAAQSSTTEPDATRSGSDETPATPDTAEVAAFLEGTDFQVAFTRLAGDGPNFTTTLGFRDINGRTGSLVQLFNGREQQRSTVVFRLDGNVLRFAARDNATTHDEVYAGRLRLAENDRAAPRDRVTYSFDTMRALELHAADGALSKDAPSVLEASAELTDRLAADGWSPADTDASWPVLGASGPPSGDYGLYAVASSP